MAHPSSSSAYIPYKQRSGWSDIEPVPQQDAEGSLVPIMYTEEYADVTSIFRALAAKTPPEYSQRALEVTEHVIRMNPAHYTVWQYRFRTLLALQADLVEELEWTNAFARENLKSYQVWHHRLMLLTHLQPELPKLREEIAFIHASLLPDAKNYHTWAYLHWLFAHFADRIDDRTHQEELEWCELMLDSEMVIVGEDEDSKGDGRNNSAWAWRWYLMVSRAQAPRDSEREIQYALSQIRKIPHNASAWNYLRGLHTHFRIPQSRSLEAVEDLASASGSSASSPRPVALAVEWVADCRAEQGTTESAKEAARLYDELGSKLDRMRAGYWQLRKREALRAA